MNNRENGFKHALKTGSTQIGFWLTLADPYTTEICAGAGFDWLLIDCEHAPQSAPLVLTQLQAIATRSGVHPMVRVASKNTDSVAVLLDLGARNLLVPMINTAAEAEAVVQACRYPPDGHRGVGGGRAAGWGRDPEYVRRAHDDVCVVTQIETGVALENIEQIAAVDGIDGLFVGPADLAASLGHLGNPDHPDVRAAVLDAMRRIRSAGKAAGILTLSEEFVHQSLKAGASFVAVGIDSHLLAKQTSALAARFRPT